MQSVGIMTEEEFEELIGSGKITVCDFSASWCGPCRMLAPILEDVSDKYKGKYFFYNIDVDSADEIATKYNVQAVPTVIVFKNGKEIDRTSGYQSFEEIERFINNAAKKD